MAALVDREQELAKFTAAARAPRGQLVAVWGRRRVGKTSLLQAFSEARRSISYTATQQSVPVELAGFTGAVRSGLGSEGLPAGYVFPDLVGCARLRDRGSAPSTAHRDP